ncbi:MAG TPA: phosphonate metabolism protein/1,5-bisphosphokinase (PRPP-forming) PhnN [Xanthobacteraceae bacterium]|nr:phosphonate metabolism protein/1,5-bisphosphokinase (PRPP-forming) PhnN [Xanthobacteraceae bacterium]
MADVVHDVARHAALGPGTLVLVVGPSGAGKDTLLAYARARLRRPEVLFARRRITRTPDGTEDHERLSPAEFESGVASGAFALHWRANGLGYALGSEVAAAVRSGRPVVANGSRAAVTEARQRFADVRVVLVSAPPAVLAARLAARGRESGAALSERLARVPALDEAPDLAVLNDGAVEQAGERLVAYLAAL